MVRRLQPEPYPAACVSGRDALEARMLIAAIILAVVAVIAVIILFVREGIEKRGYLKNRRRKSGRIPLN